MNFKAISEIRGDETRSYDVTDYKATTVGEFVDEVLSGNGKKEWGYFEFTTVKPQKVVNWNIPPEWNRYEYKRGSLLDKIPDTLRNKRIEHVTGDGGWSRMDYDITVVEENETENEYCKQQCKGFQDTGGKCFVDDCRKNETENDVRIGDRVFMDGTEVFKNIKGITYDTSGVSINKDAETPVHKPEPSAVVRAKAREICHCGVDCPNFEWCSDWCERLEQMSKMHEWDKQRFIEKACEFIDNKIYSYVEFSALGVSVDTDTLINDLRKTMKGE